MEWRPCLCVVSFMKERTVTRCSLQRGGAAISITIFDREDSGCTVPLAKAETLTSSDGYYEARLQLRPDGDVIILVQATMPDGNGPAVEAKSVYAWRSGLYDSGIDAYCANMAPIYIRRAPLH